MAPVQIPGGMRHDEYCSADGLLMVADAVLSYLTSIGWGPAEDKAQRMAAVRQIDNMAFILDHFTMPEQWHDKFCREMVEDRDTLKVTRSDIDQIDTFFAPGPKEEGR